MNSKIRVIFKIDCGSNTFSSGLLSLGGQYPDIEIVNLGGDDGLHNVIIERVIPNGSEKNINAVITETANQVEHFINVTSYIRNSRIRLLDIIQYEINGSLQKFALSGKSKLTAKLVGVASVEWFDLNKNEFHKSYNLNLLKRYSFSKQLEDNISKFVSLYSLLLSLFEDKQAKVDLEIQKIDNNISKTPSPIKSNTYETIYTRLRNELAHHRNNTSILKTYEEIEIHIDRFIWVCDEILKNHIEKV